MHKRTKHIILFLWVLLFASPQIEAQSKVIQSIKSIFTRENKISAENAYRDSIYFSIPKEKLTGIDYVSLTGNTINSLWGGDIWTEAGYIPQITLPVEDGDGPEYYAGTFNISDYTAQALEEKEDFDEEIDFSETPEEYSIWTNASINPYNVKLSESMNDTVQILEIL